MVRQGMAAETVLERVGKVPARRAAPSRCPSSPDFGGKLVVVTATGDGTRVSVVDLPELTTQRLAEVLIGPEADKPAGWIGAYFINYLDGEERNRRWPEWTALSPASGRSCGASFGLSCIPS